MIEILTHSFVSCQCLGLLKPRGIVDRHGFVGTERADSSPSEHIHIPGPL